VVAAGQEYLAYIDPSRPLWAQMDWLLLGIFAAMSLLIMAGADVKTDALIILVGTAGGLVIESWEPRRNCGRISLSSARRCGSSRPGHRQPVH